MEVRWLPLSAPALAPSAAVLRAKALSLATRRPRLMGLAFSLMFSQSCAPEAAPTGRGAEPGGPGDGSAYMENPSWRWTEAPGVARGVAAIPRQF